MERFLHRVIQDKNLPITIIRPSLTFDPGVVNIGVLRQNYGIIDRIRKDKPLVMFGDGSTSFSFTFVPDLAKGFAGVLGKKETYAGIFDNSKFRSVMPQFKAGLSLNAGLRIIVDWWEKEANTIDPEKEALENNLVSLYNSWADQVHNLYMQ